MPINSSENGSSVYTQREFSQREIHPLYQAVRELTRRYSSTKRVLDLGCSDLPTSSRLLGEGFTFFGVELDETALHEAQKHVPTDAKGAALIKSDITALPLQDKNGIDTVLALDILEHVDYKEAVGVLQRLSTFDTPPTVIVSMPIVSRKTIPTYVEGIPMVVKRRKPEAGLFDRTHKILTDGDGHKALFSEAGYEVIEEFTTNWVDGVTGQWDTVDPRQSRGMKDKAFKLVVNDMLPGVMHPINKEKREGMRKRITAYQGLYVIRPQSETVAHSAA